MLPVWEPAERPDEDRPAPRVINRRILQTRPLITVRVTPSETGTLYYHWYRDGEWFKRTRMPQITLHVEPTEQVGLDVRVTRYRDWDGRDYEPHGYPRRRIIQWLRTLASDVSHYLIQRATGQSTPAEEDWVTIGRVDDDDRWHFALESPVLSCQSWYWFGVVPVDKSGNAGTRLSLGPYWQLGRPTMPDVTVSFDDDTQRITVAEA